jgi:hypothetical protein
VRQAIDKGLLSIIGCVNQAVFSASRHRVILYRFHGRPGVRLTITGPAVPVGQTLFVGYLPDGDDYIALAAKHDTALPTALRTATAATAELPRQQIPVDITMLPDDTERAALLNRLLKHASINERYEVTRRREVPIARLTPRYKPSDRSVAFVEIRIP